MPFGLPKPFSPILAAGRGHIAGLFPVPKVAQGKWNAPAVGGMKEGYSSAIYGSGYAERRVENGGYMGGRTQKRGEA